MTKLNLLGAQRVKALTEILERRYSDEINKVDRKKLSEKSKAISVAKHLGKHELLDELEEIKERVVELNNILYNKVGVSVSIDISYNAWRMPTEVRELRDSQSNGASEHIALLKRELEDKKSNLWLVQTLEEAQEIVNSPITQFEEE